MTFTALHRAVGATPGPLTEDLLDEAVNAGTTETDDLDWKSELPPTKGLPQTDFPKDIAAMANSGGGLIVYGVTEVQKAATGRVDVGDLSEIHERALRSAAITAISPPVFGLQVYRLGADGGKRAVAVEVPTSADVPHLIYRNEYFGAPMRNNADTVWMRERQVEAMYRARFEERRHATEALDALYGEAAAGRDVTERARLIAVAHPRIPRVGIRLDRRQAGAVFNRASQLAQFYTGGDGSHLLRNLSLLQPGLRRWVAVSTLGDASPGTESWASVHHDGSVALATASSGSQVLGSEVECVVADFMALVRAGAEAAGCGEYELRVGIEWSAGRPLMLADRTQRRSRRPLYRYTPVEVSVDASAPDQDFQEQMYRLALDCVNQCGLPGLVLIDQSLHVGPA